MPTRKREKGEFCWFNLMTPNAEEARGFWGELFGWRFEPMGNGGHTLLLGEQPIGALFPNEMPGAPKTPPMIGIMIKVDDAERAAARVVELGGSSKSVMDIFGNLRMAPSNAPDGAHFDVWESKAMHGTEVDGELHGAPLWIENVTDDVARASRFYGELFGWTPQKMSNGGFDYTVMNVGNRGVAGMMPIGPEMAGMKPDWVVYFNSRNADETAALAQRLGGKVCQPVFDIEGVGRIGGICSPQGVNFAILTPRPR
jgi:predicted enzyme related to lactoylglutathione lyase